MSEADPPRSGARVADAGGELERGRECHGRRAWAAAYTSLERADRAAALAADDLELLATCAYLIGRDEEYLALLERAHRAFAEAGAGVRAARCAFWIGFRLLFRGELGRATGWLARAQRLLEREPGECAEHGYLLLPVAQQQLDAGDHDAAHASATRAVELGERFGDPDLTACALHLQGVIRMQQGRVEQGLLRLDEAMVAVSAGELSPIMAGLIYCNAIDNCQQVYALGRAREWTSALARWCDDQPEMLAFSGVCRVHRAEVLQLRGAWPDAIEEARRAGERCRGLNRQGTAAAFYQEGEVHRLRGEFALAEQAYRSASQSGLDPQPGLSLLRAAQGQTEAGMAAIRRVLGATSERLSRARLLPAYIELALLAGERQAAREGCRELSQIATDFGGDVLGALADAATGAVDLAEGHAQTALGSLRRAGQAWQRIDAPYPAARVRELIARACRELGDGDGATLELEAARTVYAQLGAAPDLARIDAPAGDAPPQPRHGLTARELEVLRLLAAGKTNKAIASELFVSEKTVERHVSNIFHKLSVSSRTAAAAFAYEHSLL